MAQRAYLREVEPVAVRMVENPAREAPASVPPRERVHEEVIVTKTPTHEVVEEIRITETPEYQRRERIVRDSGARLRTLLARVINLIWLIAGTAITLLGFRLVLRLIGADPTADFAAWLYRVSGVLLAPFEGLAAAPPVGPGVLDLPALIGMFVYAMATFIVVQFLRVVFAPSSEVITRRRVTTHPRDL